MIARRLLLYGVCILLTAHNIAAYSWAPERKRTIGAILGTACLTIAVVTVLAWSAYNLSRRRGMNVAIGVLTFLAFQSIVGTVAALTLGYIGRPLLIAIQIIYLAILWSTYIAILRAKLLSLATKGEDE